MNLYDVQVKAVDGSLISSAHRVSFSAVNVILSDLPEQPFLFGSTTITIEFRGKR